MSALLVMAVWTIVLFRQQDKETASNYYYGIGQGALYALGAFGGVYSVLRYNLKPLHKKTVLFLSLGASCWTLAACIWAYYNIVLDIEVPQPSFADTFYIFYSIFTGIGCIYVLKSIHAEFNFSSIIRPFIALFGCYFLIAVFFGGTDLLHSQSPVKLFINLQYPITDGLLFAIGFILLQKSIGHIHDISLVIVYSLLFQVLGDITYLAFESYGTYWNGSFPDVLFVISAFFQSWAILRLIPLLIHDSAEGLTKSLA